MGYKISKCQQKQHLSVNFIHRTLISNQSPTKMKGSLIILMTLIITITCDRARVDPGKARLEARDGSSVGRIDAGDARAAGRIDALDAIAASAVGRIDALDAIAVGRIDARDGSSVGRIDAEDARASGIEGSNSLLMGKLIGQGAIRSEVVGSARQQGVGPSEIEEVKGREVAESARQHVDPQDELQIGRKIKEYQQNPQDAQVRMDIGSARGGHGGPSAPMMSGPSGRAVPNPIKVLGEIKARGGDIETVEGEIVAGDAGDIDVISMKESRLDEEGRSPCGSSCPTGTICCLASRTCDSTLQMIDVRMRKDEHVVVKDVQLAPFVASPAVRVIQPVQMIDVRMRKDNHQWDEKHVQMGKFIAPIQAHAPYLKNVELAKPSD